MSSENGTLHKDEKTTLGGQVVVIAAGIGIVFLIISAVLGSMQGDGMRRFMFSYLVAFAFFLSIALGALWTVILEHLVGAHWSIVVRRIAELITATFPMLAALSLVILIPLLFGSEVLYFWTTAAADHDHLVHAKLGYLNPTFFSIRLVGYFTFWILVSRHFFKKSLEQDKSGDIAISKVLRRHAGPSMIAFAFTTAFGSFDLLMSLYPAWYSTMFGVYFFAGCIIAIYATLSLTAMVLQRSGRLVHSITVEHYHDLGKMLFAFVFFWGYVAFSQFMLIWYADLPEETIWFRNRIYGHWSGLSLVILFGHFIIPFVILMSRWSKRILPLLAALSTWMLVMHYGDLFWIVMPEYANAEFPDHTWFMLMDVTIVLGIGGLVVAAAANAARGRQLIPIKSPLLGKSLNFENY